MNKSRLSSLYRFLVIWLASLSLLYIVTWPISGHPNWFLIAVGMFVLQFFWFIGLSRHRGIISILETTGFVVVLLACLYLFIPAIYKDLNGYFAWFAGIYKQTTQINYTYVRLTVFIFGFLLSFISALLGRLRLYAVLPFASVISILLIQASYAEPVIKTHAYLCLFACAITLVYQFHDRRMASVKTSEKHAIGERPMMLVAALLGLALVCITVFMPQDPTNLEFFPARSLFNSAYFTIRDRLSDLSEFSRHELGALGYGKRDGDLGGPAKPGDRLLLNVTADGNTYLRGTVYDSYTGRRWTYSTKDTKALSESGNALYSELYDAIYNNDINLDGFISRPDLAEKSIGIKYQKIKTQTIYTLNATQDFKFNGGEPLADVDAYGNILARYPETTGFTYTIHSETIDRTDYTTYNYLVGCYNGFYQDLAHKLGSFAPDSLSRLIKNAQAIQKQYTKLPSSLPKRVRSLAAETTADVDSPYEKALVLERFLATNYTYNLDAEKVPKGADFVDYFLFESKQGYCSYFATSLTVMLRSIGIPARYVEGFLISGAPDSEDGLSHNVTAHNGHAWVEAYFEGAGWVTLECTPGFYSVSPYFPVVDETKEQQPNGVTQMQPQPEDGDSNSDDNNADLTPIPSHDKNAAFGGLKKFLAWWMWALIFLAVFVVLSSVVNEIRRLHYEKTYRMASTARKVRMAYVYMLSTLSLTGRRIRKGETPIEFAARLETGTGLLSQSGIGNFTKLFCVVRYGGDNRAENIENSDIYTFRTKYAACLKSIIHPLRYFIYRHVLGLIL